jgi:hypothetical protein
MNWWQEHHCITCHDGGILIFATNVARRRGVPVSREKLDFWTERWWYAGALHLPRGKDVKSFGGFPTLALMLRDRDRDDTRLAATALTAIFQDTKASGKWDPKALNPWIPLALAALKDAKLALEPEVRRDIEATLARLEKRILKEPTGLPDLTEDLAGWLLYATDRGTPARREELIKELLSRQRANGGWGLKRGEPNHNLVTGTALFALLEAGVPSDHAAVRKTQRFLLSQQDPDGRWQAVGRTFKIGKRFDEVETWATGLVVAALCKTIPKLPAGTKPAYVPDAEQVRDLAAIMKAAEETYRTEFLEIDRSGGGLQEKR